MTKKQDFEHTINGRDYFFMRSYLQGDELYYAISVMNDTSKGITFRMKKDESGQWKILAQVLPMWVHDSEVALNDLIEENENQ